MGERYRLLGDNRGGSDMRVGSLVTFAYCEHLGVVTRFKGGLWVVHFITGETETCWEEELEVIC
jgi:hypothetical protein